MFRFPWRILSFLSFVRLLAQHGKIKWSLSFSIWNIRHIYHFNFLRTFFNVLQRSWIKNFEQRKIRVKGDYLWRDPRFAQDGEELMRAWKCQMGTGTTNKEYLYLHHELMPTVTRRIKEHNMKGKDDIFISWVLYFQFQCLKSKFVNNCSISSWYEFILSGLVHESMNELYSKSKVLSFHSFNAVCVQFKLICHRVNFLFSSYFSVPVVIFKL